jgi:6-phosphogluconolactonase
MDVLVVRDAEQVAAGAAELFIEATAGATAARGRALVALTGGGSAPPLFAQLRGKLQAKVPWSALQVFFTDERAVPPDDDESNYGMAKRELFAKVPLDSARIHRLRGEAANLDEEARRAAKEIREIAGEPPRFDLVLLGLGPDGHICSLFAGRESSASRGDDELVRHVPAPQQVEPHIERLTSTPFLVVTARMVALQVSSGSKAEVLARAVKGREDLVACPAQWLRHAVGRVVVLATRDAASKL